MKTGITLVVVALVVIAGIAFFVLTSSNAPNENLNPGDSNANSGNAQSSGNNDGEVSGVTTYQVEIKNFAFSQEELRIKSGDTVVWTNKDSVMHTVTSDSGSEMDSELLSEEQTYSHTFNTVGIYEYYCRPHPYMKAKIIVE